MKAEKVWIPITARISPKQRQLLVEIAEREDRSISSVIRRSLEVYAREVLRREVEASRTNPSE